MKDPILDMLITLSEKEKPHEQDITLLVSGFLISGYIVSHTKWAKHHAASDAIVSTIEQYLSTLPEPPEPTRNYIHLRDAKYYLPGSQPIPGNQSIYIRIPLASVHGFSFGKLEHQP